MRLVLLYQVGIANVFQVEPGNKMIRILQHSYDACEAFCRGAKWAGVTISVCHYDYAGDAKQHSSSWLEGPGDLWLDKKCYADLCTGSDLRPAGAPGSEESE